MANDLLLISVIRDPLLTRDLGEADWGLLLRQARSLNVLGRLLQGIEAGFPSEEWPRRLRETLRAEIMLANHRRDSLFWELGALVDVFSVINVRPTLLKGSAYLASGFDFARYRTFGDIDLLIPAERLDEAEKQLMINGWFSTKNDEYDQYYYRTWMHELPPMQHIHRGTSLDVHHGILPRTAKYKPDSSLLFKSSCPAMQLLGSDVLSSKDMILHAAAHLFSESEEDNAFRNLLDIADLLQIYLKGKNSSLTELVDRSVELDLVVPLVMAGRYLGKILNVKEAVFLNDILATRGLIPKKIAVFDEVYETIFQIINPDFSRRKKHFARMLLLVRGHYLRMPIRLLIPHFLRKSFRPAKSN